MKHVVVDKHICPKCLKSNMGAAGAILDLIICPECVQKYKIELMPRIENLVRMYFKPEVKNKEILTDGPSHIPDTWKDPRPYP